MVDEEMNAVHAVHDFIPLFSELLSTGCVESQVLSHEFKDCHFQWANGFQQITRQRFVGT